MKVDLNALNGPALDGVTSPQRSKPEAGATSAANAEPVVGEDIATLSVDRVHVDALVAKALDASPIRQDKVDALRQAIQNGEYKVDPVNIAEAMIQQSKGPGPT
jgi:flagellar biosynthesis anti-sigma factor FlgM